MVSNHLELELIAKQIHEARVREADAARQIAAACVTTSIAQRWPSLVSIAGGKRVRWWFWTRFTSQKAPAAPSTLVNANERSATLSLETILVSGAMFPADPYEALVIIARGNRQRHERLVTQRS